MNINEHEIIEPNGKLEFFYQFTDKDPKTIMTLSPESDLDAVLTAFEGFLKAAGYSFDGVLDFVDNEGPKEGNNE